MSLLIYFKKYIKKELVLECINYYEENDIFLNLNFNYYQEKQKLIDKKHITYDDLESFIKNTRGSKFSFFKKYNYALYKIYNSQKNNTSKVEYNLNYKNSIFIKPNFQDNFVDKKISKLINENKDRKNLIIDLRHSVGGSTRNCAKICNLFLPKGNIFMQEFKNKKTTFISNESYYKFTKIFILVDQYTASSSEILAYALKSKLKDCILIGYKTFGKTVGQDIITNKKQGFIFSTVTFKWYIDDFSYDTFDKLEIIEPVNGDILQTLEQQIENSYLE